jgi:hypothetical protein
MAYDPDFAQGLEPGRPWVLVKGDKRTCPLEYRDAETGARRLVPNVPYNQPAAWRASTMRFYQTERLEAARRMTAARIRYEQRLIDDAMAGAERCRLAAEEYERVAASGAYPREA